MSDLEELRRLSDAVVNVGPWEAGTDAAPDNLTLPNATWLYGVRDSGPFYPGFTVGGFEERALAAFAAASMNFVRDLLSNPTSSVSTEGVADWPHVEDAYGRCEVCHPATPENDHPDGGCNAIGESWPCAAERLRLTAINPDSPVEPAPDRACPDCGHPERHHGPIGTPSAGCWNNGCDVKLAKGKHSTACHRGRPFPSDSPVEPDRG